MTATMSEEAQLQRIVAETRKLLAEERKFSAEYDRDTAATIKAYAETAKINRDRWLAPLIALAAAIGTLIGSGAAVYRLIIG